MDSEEKQMKGFESKMLDFLKKIDRGDPMDTKQDFD